MGHPVYSNARSVLNLARVVTFLSVENRKLPSLKATLADELQLVVATEFSTEFYSRFHGSNRPESASSYEHRFCSGGIFANVHRRDRARAPPPRGSAKKKIVEHISDEKERMSD